MKKFIILMMLFLLVACSPNKDSQNNTEIDIPDKINPIGYNVEDSSITTANLDDYLLRDDVYYCDLRYYSWVLKNGHIAGFSFVPYYDFIASRNGNNAFFRHVEEGDKGVNFKPLYEESITVLNKMFPKDKYIFLVSQSGVESYYMSILLEQFGYDINKIYNIGGVTGTIGSAAPYIKVGKHFVSGNGSIPTDPTGEMFKVNFEKLDIKLIEE